MIFLLLYIFIDYTIRSINWDGLTEVTESIVLLPWRTKDQRQFLTWFLLEQVIDKFTVKIYPKITDVWWIDPNGKQSLTAFVDNSYVYIASTANVYSYILCWSIYDLKDIEKGEIYYVNSTFYSYFDFTEDNSNTTVPYDLNFRDLLFINVNPIYKKENKNNEMQHYLISTCYNHGIIFFKAINLYNIER